MKNRHERFNAEEINALLDLFNQQACLGRSFYFAHPESSYFGVARIGRDQLADYAERRGVSIEQAETWCRPNLD